MGGERSLRAGALGTLSTAGKYLFFGGMALALDLTVLSVLISTPGCPAWFSVAVVFAVLIVFAFFMQMRYTFRSNALTRRAMVRYGTLLAANMVFTVIVVDRFGSWWDAHVQGKIFSTGIATLWNYFIMKHRASPRREEGSGWRRRSRP